MTDSTPSLAGKRALVTGASHGCGAAIAQALAAAGADIAIVAHTEEALAATADAIRALGRDCLVIAADLGTVDGVRHATDTALAHAAQWNILVNNAGVAITMPLAQMTAEAWDTTMAVNTRAPMLISQALMPGMVAAGGGKIINISSLTTFVGAPTAGAYAASKAALNQLTMTMAVEWGGHNIQVNAICPTIILTEMGKKFWLDPANVAMKEQRLARIPMHRFTEVGDVVNLAMFLAGPGSGFVNGVCMPLDGGQHIAP